MEGWKYINLGDIIHIKHGYGFKGKYFVEEPNHSLLLTPGNFAIGGGFKSDKMKYYDGPINDEFVLCAGDVIVTMTDLSMKADTLGYSAKIPNNPENTYLHNQRLGLVSLKTNEFDLDYIYWLLRTYNYQKYIAGSSSGATVKHTSPKKIYSAKLLVPESKVTQKRIADILSSYDDLIENNLKRIKLLEQAAQNIYKEWFVNLRFPGYENTPVNEETGLPEGWEEKMLKDLCHLTMGQSPKSEYYNLENEGLPFHQGVTGYGNRFVTHSTYCKKITRIAEEGDILCSVRAPVGRLNISPSKLIIGRGLSAIRNKNGFQSFQFCQLKNHFYQEDMIGGGAIFNSVTKKVLEEQKLLSPDIKTQEGFEKIVIPLDNQIVNLDAQNQKLKVARDILLPRLMNRTIEV